LHASNGNSLFNFYALCLLSRIFVLSLRVT
jgi:hypothetical protein